MVIRSQVTIQEISFTALMGRFFWGKDHTWLTFSWFMVTSEHLESNRICIVTTCCSKLYDFTKSHKCVVQSLDRL